VKELELVIEIKARDAPPFLLPPPVCLN